MSRQSRRDIIKGASATAVFGVQTAPKAAPALGTGKGVQAFDHVVVLMLENRSFDNLLGHLYGADGAPRGQPFEGVHGKELSNPIPAYAPESDRKIVRLWSGSAMDNPNPDPGEEYPHVSTQLFGVVKPEENRFKSATSMVSPFNTPQPVPAIAPMNGFVTDYIANFTRTQGRLPRYAEYSRIMQCYRPQSLPVISTLAREFAVCDHWFCDVPSQTFANRSFFHAASSSGAVINEPYAHWIRQNDAETVLERMQAKGLSWRIYFDDRDVFPLTGLIHYSRLEKFISTNFLVMQNFFDAVEAGTLPAYSFIEPRLFINHNDMHPPIKILGETQRSSILDGEILVNKIYDAIRLSDSKTGSNFLNTLFVIIFDEHGGCYDHVSPPAALPPDPAKVVGQFGFQFDRLGVRVPAVLVSAYIEPGTIINTPLSHSSMIRTLSDRWSLGHFTERDRATPNTSEAFNRSLPRAREEWPVIRPRELPPAVLNATNHEHPLNALQRSIVELGNAVAGDSLLHPGEVMTVFEAIHTMRSGLERQERAIKK
jgi:phospholipase C